MSWQTFLAINVLAGSLIILLQRILLHKDKSEPVAFVVVSQSLTAILVGVIAVVHGFHWPNITNYWLPILAMFGFYSIGHVVYAKTLKQVEASVFTTLLNSNVIWIVLISYLLFNERPTVGHIVGTVLILLSVILLAERTGKFKLDRSIWMGLLTGLIFG